MGYVFLHIFDLNIKNQKNILFFITINEIKNNMHILHAVMIFFALQGRK